MKRGLVAILAAMVAWVATPASFATIKTWSGASNGNWNVAANWTNNVIPVSGDDLVFPANIGATNSTNNIGGLALNSITINGTNYVLRGNSITLTNGITAAYNGSSTVELPTTLVATATFSTTKFATLSLAGSITGQGGILTVGNGALVLAGTGNNYFGDTTVNSGFLFLNAPGGEAIHENSTLTIGDGVGSDTVQYGAANQINSGVKIVINSSGVLDLNGFGDTVGGLVLDGGNIKTGGGIMILNGGITTPGFANNASTIAGIVTFNFNLVMNITNGPTGMGLNIPAEIRGSAGIIKNGPGQATLMASNSYAGPTTVNEGTLRIEDDFALGAVTNGTIVNAGGTLLVGGLAGSLSEPLTLNGNGTAASGALQVEGGVDWNTNFFLASDTTISSTTFSILRINGSISGSASLTKTGPGTLHFAGSAPNSYDGTTFVNEGRLELNKSALNVSIVGPLVIGNDLGAADSVVVQLQAPTQINNNSPVTINSSGLFDQANQQDAVGSISGSGHINIGNAFLNVGVNNTSSEFSGLISGIGGDLSKLGTGTLTLSGTNTYTGTTTVSAGTLIVNGSQPQSLVSVLGGATLGGSGIVGAISSSGIVSPGASPGILTASNITFTPSSTFKVELNGPSPGVGYDMLNVRGTNNLANSILSLLVSSGFAPFEGESFTIISNDGVDAVNGAFAGLGEGSTLFAGPLKFRVSYTGGSGNDVTLTFTNPPLAILNAQITGGNGNFVVDPNECNNLSLVITNASTNLLTNVAATLSSPTAGVLITQPRSAYPNFAAGNKGTNVTAFQISTAPSFACGTIIELDLRMATATGSFFSKFFLPTPVTDGPPVRLDNNTVIGVADVGFGESTSVVTGITNAIRQVTVSTYISHFDVSELTLNLIGPDGTTVVLSAGNGGVGDGYGTNCADGGRTLFDDTAITSIAGSPAPFVGTFRPQQPLAAFIGKTGTNANGTWRLRVTDGTPGASATLHCWSLIISPACNDGGGTCNFCPGIFSGSIDNADPVQNGRLLLRDETGSCDFPKPCPAVVAATNLHYDAYRFTNASPNSACVQVSLTAACGADHFIFPVTYLNSFDPANVCSNYLADLNVGLGTGVTESYTFSVPGSSVFIVVVSEEDSGLGCTNYTLAVSGVDCPPPALNIASIPASKVRLDWPTTGAGYLLESTPSLAVPNWKTVTNQPIIRSSRFNVTNNVTGTNQLYRLRKPL